MIVVLLVSHTVFFHVADKVVFGVPEKGGCFGGFGPGQGGRTVWVLTDFLSLCTSGGISIELLFWLPQIWPSSEWCMGNRGVRQAEEPSLNGIFHSCSQAFSCEQSVLLPQHNRLVV